MSPFDLAGLRKQLEELSVQTEDPEFWNNPDTAQNILKKKKSLETRLEKYESLEKGFDDMEELMELAEEMEDEEEADSIVEAFGNLQQQLETLKLDTLLSGKYDHNNAII